MSTIAPIPDPAPERIANPLLQWDGLPRFDQIEPAHVEPAVRQMLTEAGAEFAELESTVLPTWEGSFARLETIDLHFERIWGPVGHLMGVKTSDELLAAYQAVQGDVSELGTRMIQSQALYDNAVAIRGGEEWARLNEGQQRVVSAWIRDAELAGVALDEASQTEYATLRQRLTELTTQFKQNVLEATKAFELVLTDPSDVNGIPETDRKVAAQSYNDSDDGRDGATAEDGPWRFTLDGQSFLAYTTHGPTRELREEMYRAYVTRASAEPHDNTQNVHQIIGIRQRMAELVGHENHVQVSLAKKMAGSVANVERMHDELRETSVSAARDELETLRTFAAERGAAEPLMNWDIAFWQERQKEDQFQITDEQLRPYFPIEKVLEGMFALTNDLFEVTIEAADGEAPIWHEDVRFFNVLNSDGDRIASFYLDPYTRPEDKNGGAWMNTCLGRKMIDGKRQLPVAYLCCNGTQPTDGVPALMTFREVETLFHEFGHGLQHMLTTIDVADAAGIKGIEWDAVEIASQFMENWCYHKPTVDRISGHHETGEPLPDELFQKLVAARTHAAAYMMTRQLTFGMADLVLYGEYAMNPTGRSPSEIFMNVATELSPLPPLPEDQFLCAFAHIFAGGYSAGYFSYKWSEVLSADAFSAFEEAGLDDTGAVAALGHRFRDTFLALGGSRHPMEVFKEFRGREPNSDALLRHNGLTN